MYQFVYKEHMNMLGTGVSIVEDNLDELYSIKDVNRRIWLINRCIMKLKTLYWLLFTNYKKIKWK